VAGRGVTSAKAIEIPAPDPPPPVSSPVYKFRGVSREKTRGDSRREGEGENGGMRIDRTRGGGRGDEREGWDLVLN